MLEFLISNIESQNKTCSIFLDLSKAFDCVEHIKLTQILEYCGIRGLPLNWVKLYLMTGPNKLQSQTMCHQKL